MFVSSNREYLIIILNKLYVVKHIYLLDHSLFFKVTILEVVLEKNDTNYWQLSINQITVHTIELFCLFSLTILCTIVF